MPQAIPYVIATAAVASAGVGVANYTAAQEAADAQRSLANEQASRLKLEGEARTAQAAEQAKTGASFGFGDTNPKSLETGFGFGNAPSSSPNSGRGQITGMS